LSPLRLFFFFSSRRRHTRSKRDWSSDVCSSDLRLQQLTFSSRVEDYYEVETISCLRHFESYTSFYSIAHSNTASLARNTPIDNFLFCRAIYTQTVRFWHGEVIA